MRRGKTLRMINPDPNKAAGPLNLVNRPFCAQRPNQLGVSGFSVPQISGVRDEGRPLAIG